MITTIITPLIALNPLSQPADWEQLSSEEQQELTNQVIDTDLTAF